MLTLPASSWIPAMRVISILVSALFLLAACGTRGPLTLPPKADLADHNSKSAESDR